MMSGFDLPKRKRIRRSRSKIFRPSASSTLNITLPQSHVMSTSMEKFSSSPENTDVKERNSGTKTNEKGEIQKNEKETLQWTLAKELYPVDIIVRNWPIFSLLKPEFIPQIYTVVVYGVGGNSAIIVTKDKNVYDLDNSKFYNEDFNEDYYKDDYSKTGDIHALCLKKIKELCGKNIKTFAYNSYFILALTEEGEVYYWQFINKSDVEGSRFTRVASLSEKRIVDIACGSKHFLALTSNGKVYAWGGNIFEEFGSGNLATLNSVQRIKYDLNKENVVRIACGSTFSIAMTDENKLYAWGNNENGQILSDNASFSFTTIGDSSTDHRTLNCTNSIQVGYLSNSENSEFGYNATSNNVQSQKHYVYPREITMITNKIVKVTCGFGHTLVLTDKGEIYAWGDNSHGQVGVNNNWKSCGLVMVNMPQMEKVLDIAAHGNLSVAEGYDKSIYVWGDHLNQCFITPFRTMFSSIYEPFAYNSCRIMHKPLTVCPNIYDDEEELNILESLEAAFDDPSTSDFTIKVEGQSIHVHKSILKIRCQYFKNMFQHNWIENIQSTSDSVYTVSEKFSYVVYKAFLKYLYTATIDITLENALELVELADMYCETNLKKKCNQIIKQAITVSNVAFFYKKAIEYNAEELEEFCFQFACRHYSAVTLSEEYAKLDKSTIINFTRRAAKEGVFKT